MFKTALESTRSQNFHINPWNSLSKVESQWLTAFRLINQIATVSAQVKNVGQALKVVTERVLAEILVLALKLYHQRKYWTEATTATQGCNQVPGTNQIVQWEETNRVHDERLVGQGLAKLTEQVPAQTLVLTQELSCSFRACEGLFYKMMRIGHLVTSAYTRKLKKVFLEIWGKSKKHIFSSPQQQKTVFL